MVWYDEGMGWDDDDEEDEDERWRRKVRCCL
jgi:hypothetical protein